MVKARVGCEEDAGWIKLSRERSICPWSVGSSRARVVDWSEGGDGRKAQRRRHFASLTPSRIHHPSLQVHIWEQMVSLPWCLRIRALSKAFKSRRGFDKTPGHERVRF